MTHAPDMSDSAYEQILSVARRLATSSDLTVVLGMVIDALRDTLRAERASVFQYDAAKHELFATRAHGLSNDLRLNADLGIIGEAARTRLIVNIPDAYADSRFNADVDRQTGFRTRCLLTIPLIDHDDNLVGVAQVLNKKVAEEGVFGEFDEQIAEHLAVQAGVALKRASLMQAELQKEKLEADLAIAKRIQLAALPDSLPTFEHYDIAGSTFPADETGGDAFDIIEIEPQHGNGRKSSEAIVFIGDATGHGIGPALSVTETLAMVRIACRMGASSDDIAQHVNWQLHHDLPVGRFVTAFIGRLDTQKHTLVYSSAGQAPILLIRARDGELEVYSATGAPFGIEESFICDPAETIDFEPGDVFALLSDGYFEAMDRSGNMLGMDAIVDVIRQNLSQPCSVIHDALRAQVEAHGCDTAASDDQTAVLIKRTG